MNFKYKLGNLELKSCDDHLLSDFPHTTAEIVQYSHLEKNHWAIAYWIKDKEGYNLQFVGRRPLDKEVNIEDFFKLISEGQNMLDYFFEKESEENDT
jgi:hypothetical protein